MNPRGRPIHQPLAVLLFLAGCRDDEGAPFAVDSTAIEACADGPTLDGIDVSKWQGAVQWPVVAGAGLAFAFIRVSDGLGYPDGRFEANWSGARAAGVLRGAYQYFRPGQDAIAQANLFLERMGDLEPDDLPPVIDVEATDGQSPDVITAKVHAWIDHVESATDRRPMIYTGLYFWRDQVGSADFVDYPLWIAQYGPDCPNLPEPWTGWAFHQTSSSGRVAGVSGDVDTNLWNGDLDALLAFAAGSAAGCGDGRCDGDESAADCPEDCPACATVPPRGRIVDDTEVCVTFGGTPSSLRTEMTGHGGSLRWAYTSDSAHEDTYAEWQLDFAESGRYRVEAYTAAPFAQSKRATYVIQHAGVADRIVLNQSVTDGWSLVGDYDFVTGGSQWILLSDNTGEPLSGKTQIVFDAIRLTRLESPDGGPVEPRSDASASPSDEDADDARCAQSSGCSLNERRSSSSTVLVLFLCVGAAARLGHRSRRAG